MTNKKPRYLIDGVIKYENEDFRRFYVGIDGEEHWRAQTMSLIEAERIARAMNCYNALLDICKLLVKVLAPLDKPIPDIDMVLKAANMYALHENAKQAIAQTEEPIERRYICDQCSGSGQHPNSGIRACSKCKGKGYCLPKMD